jgi:hypothetical protein
MKNSYGAAYAGGNTRVANLASFAFFFASTSPLS